MQRRNFIASSLAAAAAATTSALPPASAQPTSPRLFYELRKYTLITGPQMLKMTDAYLADALIPALNRLGVAPIGAFRLDFGPETPTLYLLLPAPSIDVLVGAGARLAQDAEFVKAAAAFNTVSATQPAFHRIESSLLHAFEGFPTVHLPAAKKEKRIFQMRTYENPTPAAHDRKLEMFHQGEFEIFRNTGLEAVFFGETLIGPRMPNLTYMLTFKDIADMDAKWNVFRTDPAWKKLSTNPRYSAEAIVSNISNLILTPTSYSQI
jgi:hypothetical protein